MDIVTEEVSEGIGTPIGREESRLYSSNPTPRLTPRPSTLNLTEQLSRTNSNLPKDPDAEAIKEVREEKTEFSPLFVPPKGINDRNIILAEEKKYTSIQEIYLELRKKVGIELRKVANTDPPKKQPANQPGFQPPKKEKKKKKKKVPFAPPNGVKRTPQYSKI